MRTIATAAPAKNSAPNTAGAKASAPDKKAWSAEIHTPAGEYNANLAVADIVPDHHNRKPEDAVADEQLADSIKADGLVQPIAVRPCPKYPDACVKVLDNGLKKPTWAVLKCQRDKKNTDPIDSYVLYAGENERDAERAAAIYRTGSGWQIIAGERRWRAHRRIGAKTIRGFIHRGETNASAAIKQTVENTTRLDLNPIEEARQMKRLEIEGVPQKEIGKRFGGKSQPVVSQMLKLLTFPEATQRLFATGELSPAHGEGLGRYLAWPKVLDMIAKHAAHNGWEAKRLRDHECPIDAAIAAAGLGTVIYTGESYYDERPQYKVSPELAKQPGFFPCGYNEWIYLKPTDPQAPNLWLPEKGKQDAARAAAAKKAETSEKAKQSGLSPAEKAKRQKVVAENKQARTESALAHVVVLQRIKDLKDFDGASVRVLAQTAISSHWKIGRSERIKSMGDLLGVKRPAGPSDADDIEWMAKLTPVDAMRLAIACICDADSEAAGKFAHPICDRIEHVLGDKQTKVLREKAAQVLATAAAKKSGAIAPPLTQIEEEGREG